MEEMTKTAGASALSPARRRICVALLVVLGFSLGCSEFAVIGVEQEIADAYGVTLAEAGQLISFFAMTYAFLTPLLTLATGRFKRFTRRCLLGGVLRRQPRSVACPDV